MSESVQLRREGRILAVRLDRPQKRNAITSEMVDALADAVALAESERVAVIVLSGAPGFFSAGADIAGYVDAVEDAAALADFTSRAQALCSALTASSTIVVAAVDGVAMGGGFELVLSADLVVASDRSRFGLPEIKLGLIPGWGGTQRLVRFLGPNRAKEAVLLGEAFGAQQAQEWGIVNRVVSPEQVDAAALDLARELADRAPLALAAGKAAITAAYDPELGTDSGSRAETEHLLRLFGSADGREGIAAFVQKRPATFTGD